MNHLSAINQNRMTGHRSDSVYQWHIVFATAFLLSASGAQRPRAEVQAKSLPTREQLLQVCRHREQLVRSAASTWERRIEPTDPARIALIKQVVGSRIGAGPDDYKHCIYTKEIAQSDSFVARWWRKGVKEKMETFDWGTTALATPKRATAYDGQLVRSLEARNIGMIYAGGGRWTNDNRAHPFAFIYEFMSEPYSKLMAGAPDLRIDSTDRGVEASFQNPANANNRLVLVFDASLRMIAREVFYKLPFDKSLRIYERHRLSDYQTFTDESGEPIEFPMSDEIHYFGRPGIADCRSRFPASCNPTIANSTMKPPGSSIDRRTGRCSR